MFVSRPRVALEAIRGAHTLAEITSEYGVQDFEEFPDIPEAEPLSIIVRLLSEPLLGVSCLRGG